MTSYAPAANDMEPVAPEGMQLYSAGAGAIRAFAAGEDFIRLLFADGRIYRYTNESCGPEKVFRMKALAAAGQGLLTYVNKHVRDSYAERERRRAELQTDDDWKDFLARLQPLLHAQQNRILIPTAFSPLR